MNSIRSARAARTLAFIILCGVSRFVSADAPAGIPIIYSSDLLHPYDDPDDHFDLATLFALPELDVRAIILDLGERQKDRSGRVPLEQVMRVSGRRVPCATGLARKLSSPADEARDAPLEEQRGIEIVLNTLRGSHGRVILFATGSLRDICAAFNREPELFRTKVRALYVNAGNAVTDEIEWNVRLDPHAYVGMMKSSLPIYWCPCLPFGHDYSTYWQFQQVDVLQHAPTSLQNFFIYALQRTAPQELDPIAALTADLRAWHRLVWEMRRNMWCTAPLLHAAGRDARREKERWSAIRRGVAGHPASQETQSAEGTLFEFIPVHVEIDPAGKTRVDRKRDRPNMQLFHVNDSKQYGSAMRDCLGDLLAHFPASRPATH